MIEAGADELPEDDAARGLRARASRDPEALRRAGRARAQVGKPKWLDAELTAELDAQHGDRDRRAHRRGRPARGRRDRRGARRTSSARRSRWTRPRRTSPRQIAGPLEPRPDPRAAARLAAVEGPVREQFERRAARADRRRAGLEGAQVRQAALLFERIVERRRAAVPGRCGRGRDGEGLADEAVTSRRPPRRSTRTSSARRSRSTSAARTVAARRRSARSRPRSASRRARTARPSSRAGRRRSSRSSRSAPPRRGSGSTTSRSRTSAATCTTTTSRPTRSGRRASCAARSGATSATGRSHSGRSSR